MKAPRQSHRDLTELFARRMGWLCEPVDIERMIHQGLNMQQITDVLAALDSATENAEPSQEIE